MDDNLRQSALRWIAQLESLAFDAQWAEISADQLFEVARDIRRTLVSELATTSGKGE